MDNAWQVFGAIAVLVAGWTLLIFGVLKAMLTKNSTAIEKRVGEVLCGIAAQDKKNQELERSILELKADLPLNYVRKEDFIRHEVVINTKLDRLRDLIEGIKEDWRKTYGKRSND